MSDNTERFTGRVVDYARWRSGYPTREVLGFLRGVCGMEPARRVADVGAGTGMLTELLLKGGAEVVAIEPNREMRLECEHLLERWPGLRVMDGTAEATGLASASVSMVTAGRAFHWFEPEGAAREFRRVLQPGGWVALLSVGPARGEDPQSRQFEALQRAHEMRKGYVESREERKGKAAAFLRGLTGGTVRHAEFTSDRRLNWEGLVGFLGSLSCTPQEKEAGYPGMVRELEAFFRRWSVGGELVMPEVCSVSAGRLA